MLTGETLGATLRPNFDLDGVLALYSSNTECTGTTCDNEVVCKSEITYGNESFTGYVAPHDGWYTIVVDTKNDPGSAYDDYKLDIYLDCLVASCGCN